VHLSIDVRAPIYYDVRLVYTRFETASHTTRRSCNPHGEGKSSPRKNLFCPRLLLFLFSLHSQHRREQSLGIFYHLAGG
jgi:hypothetical protein